MSKKSKKYSRGYKVLVSILFMLISLALSLVLWELCYDQLTAGSWIKCCVYYCLMALANLGISVNLVNIIITGGHKRSLLSAIDTKPKKAILALSNFALALFMTIICSCWFCFGYGPIC